MRLTIFCFILLLCVTLVAHGAPLDARSSKAKALKASSSKTTAKKVPVVKVPKVKTPKSVNTQAKPVKPKTKSTPKPKARPATKPKKAVAKPNAKPATSAKSSSVKTAPGSKPKVKVTTPKAAKAPTVTKTKSPGSSKKTKATTKVNSKATAAKQKAAAAKTTFTKGKTSSASKSTAAIKATPTAAAKGTAAKGKSNSAASAKSCTLKKSSKATGKKSKQARTDEPECASNEAEPAEDPCAKFSVNGCEACVSPGRSESCQFDFRTESCSKLVAVAQPQSANAAGKPPVILVATNKKECTDKAKLAKSTAAAPPPLPGVEFRPEAERRFALISDHIFKGEKPPKQDVGRHMTNIWRVGNPNSQVVDDSNKDITGILTFDRGGPPDKTVWNDNKDFGSIIYTSGQVRNMCVDAFMFSFAKTEGNKGKTGKALSLKFSATQDGNGFVVANPVTGDGQNLCVHVDDASCFPVQVTATSEAVGSICARPPAAKGKGKAKNGKKV